MKIPHRDLEEARQNPGAYVRKVFRGGRQPFRYSLFRAWQLTIFRYHQSRDLVAAKSDLEDRFKKFLSGRKHFDDYYEDLQNYVRDFERLKHVVVDTAARVTMNLGPDVQMIGEISRIDVSPDGGYSAVLIANSEQMNWQEQLRMPLLQKNFAETFSVSPERMKVGIYTIDGKHEFVSYSPSDIADAEKEARSIARRLLATAKAL